MELSLLGECICSIYSMNSASPLEMHLTLSLLEQFALPLAREERISLAKMLFATRQILPTNSKDALVNLSRRLFAERRHTERAMERLGGLRGSHSLWSLLTRFANLEDEFR